VRIKQIRARGGGLVPLARHRYAITPLACPIFASVPLASSNHVVHCSLLDAQSRFAANAFPDDVLR
jgi:hypothetical protein